MTESMDERVTKALESIRPMLQADGGDIQLIGIKDGIVQVQLRGACGTCPMAQMTLKMGVEKELKRQVPEVKEVVAI
jgi:Fe-S cluster biogenesis protein NfuA